MEKILELASEIGHLIRETDIYRRYERAARELAADKTSSDILDRFYSLATGIEERRHLGDIIEEYEVQELESLRAGVNRSTVILAYLKAEKEYAELLMKIQKEIKSNE